MTSKIYSIYDSKAEAWGQPFFLANRGTAIRSFTDACNDPSTMLHKHSSDFTLFEIGDFDDQTGQIVTYTAPVALGLAQSYRKPDFAPVLSGRPDSAGPEHIGALAAKELRSLESAKH